MPLPDLKYAARTLRKSPVFTLTAVVTIALGIGASTAIFSVTNAVLLRPLPYHEPERLVLACGDLTKRGVRDWPFSNADFMDLRSGAAATFEDFSAVQTDRRIWPAEDGSPEQIRVGSVTPNFFGLLGAKVALGRDFSEADGEPQVPSQPGSTANAPAPRRLPDIAILSHQYWLRRYGGDRSVLGRTTRSGAQIVGVLAPGFELLMPPNLNVDRLPDVWLVARLAYDPAQRNTAAHRVIGRLKAGASLEQARAQADAVSAGIRKVDHISETAGFRIRIEPMQRYVSAEIRPALLALMGAAIFLLLIACANVANLLLVRASLRGRELAVRTALGAGSWRLIRQMLTEALLLSGIGAIVGVGLAWIGIRQLLIIAPANVPRLSSITIDPIVLGFTAVAALVAASIFGLVPALQASQPNIIHILRTSGRTSGLGGSRLLTNGVVVAEVALSFVLLIGSGLMIRSFLVLQRIDPGYEPRGVLTFLLLGGGNPAAEQRAAFTREIKSRLTALPGVEAVTASSPFPLAGGFGPIRWGTEEALADASKFQAVDFQVVLPGYFETLRTPLIAGRTFTEADNTPSRNVVVIDEVLAQKAFPKESAIGKRILTRLRTPEAEWVEVIGVVVHQRSTSLAEPGREQIYFTDGFLQHGAVNRWAVRTAGDPARLGGPVRAEIAKLGSGLLTAEVQPMETLVERAKSKTRFSLLLIGVFATIAAVLAGVGLYGVLSTVVRQRTAEIGVRMAIGADPCSIFGLIVGKGLLLSLAGVAVGFVAAFGLTRLMNSMLVGVGATDLFTFVAMAVFFLLIATIASWLPARRAAGLDPTTALREE